MSHLELEIPLFLFIKRQECEQNTGQRFFEQHRYCENGECPRQILDKKLKKTDLVTDKYIFEVQSYQLN